MSTNTYDGRGAQFDWVVPRGLDAHITVTATQDGQGVDLTGSTIFAAVFRNGAVLAVLDTELTATNKFSIAVPADLSSTIESSRNSWSLSLIRGGIRSAWLAGKFTSCDPSQPEMTPDWTSITVEVGADIVVEVGTGGTQGATGPAGPAGPTGAKGDPGTPGTQGVPGNTGPEGPAGPEGDQGVKGDQGGIGPEGPAGPEGDQGTPGESYKIVGYFGSSKTPNDLPSDGMILANWDRPGVPMQDTQFIDGWGALYQPTPALGSPGGGGPSDPEYGDLYSYYEGGLQWINSGKIVGPEGPQGIQGTQGPQGEDGPTGPEGPDGPQGTQGVKGDQGIQGVQGLKGDKGDKGDTGDTGAEGPMGVGDMTGSNNLSEITDPATATTNIGALAKVAAGASVENIGAVEWNVNVVPASGSTENLDVSRFGTHEVTLSEACALSFLNPAPAGKESEFKLILHTAGFEAIWPSSVVWPGGKAPTQSAGTDVYVFSTVNGVVWYGSQAGADFKAPVIRR